MSCQVGKVSLVNSARAYSQVNMSMSCVKCCAVYYVVWCARVAWGWSLGYNGKQRKKERKSGEQ